MAAPCLRRCGFFCLRVYSPLLIQRHTYATGRAMKRKNASYVSIKSSQAASNSLPGDFDVEYDSSIKESFVASQAPHVLHTKDKISFRILEKGDRNFGPIILNAKLQKSREKKKIFLVEDEIISTLPLDSMQQNTRFYKVKPHHLRLWSDLETPPGVMAICSTPNMDDLQLRLENTLPITVICDQIRDPGSMGILLRVAAAINAEQFIAMKGCVDLWDPKVMRAGAGGHFKVVTQQKVNWESLRNHISPESRVFLSDCRPIVEETLDSTASYQSISKLMTSPEQRTEKGEIEDLEYRDPARMKLYRHVQIPSYLYSATKLRADTPLVLFISADQSDSFSPEISKFALDHNAERLHLPLDGNSALMNPSVTASILLFDFKRQLQ